MAQFDPVFLPLDELLGVLATQRFYLGVDTHLRLQRFLVHFSRQAEGSLDTLRFQLAALLCHSADEQELFYRIFDDFARAFFEDMGQGEVDKPPVIPKDNREIPPIAPSAPFMPPETKTSATPVLPAATVGRSGPIRVELKFPANPLRIWNTAEMDQAVRPLREKEWTPVQEWDIPATILRTIRAGGMPTFEMRRRKRPPQYLLLIDQKSPRDHLAGLYAELAVELNRRDITAEYFFYDAVPHRCWKDRRDPGSFTTVESLQSEYAGYKLLLVGGPDGLLERPDLRPSNLALDLRENWSQVALLCLKPTSEWGNAELTLCQLFPVVPANAAGIQTLLVQWGATEVFSPQYWKSASPEATVPETRLERPQDADELIEELQRYLGRNGFQWLCAAAVYPEIYWELTALLHDESIPPDKTRDERDMNRVWWVALLRLSRLGWFRQGSIPAPVRERLRRLFDARLPLAQRQAVRAQILQILDDNPLPDQDSYAAANRAFTIAWLDYERAVVQPDLSEAARTKLETEFREQTAAGVALSDIEDAVGRKLFQEMQAGTPWPPAPEGSVLHVLWIDDKPETNLSFQKMLQEKLAIQFLNVSGTEEALETLAQRGFHLIVSDTKRADDTRAGIKMMQVFQEKQVRPPVMFSTTFTSAERCRGELLQLGAKAVLINRKAEQEFIEARVLALQQPSPASGFQLLWVDDHPENNTGINRALTERGLAITLAINTEEAFAKLAQQNFQAIISDLGRGSAREAGLDMLRQFRERGVTTPLGFFAMRTNEYRENLLAAGAALATNNGDEIERWVLGIFEQWQTERSGTVPDTPPSPAAPGLQVLWVDDDPENNERFQEQLNELMHAIFTNAVGTAAALEYSARSHFDVIVSDISRHGNNEAGADMLRALHERNVTTPVIFYTTPQMVEKYAGELRELGAAGVFDSKREIQTFLGGQLREKQQPQKAPTEQAAPAEKEQLQKNIGIPSKLSEIKNLVEVARLEEAMENLNAIFRTDESYSELAQVLQITEAKYYQLKSDQVRGTISIEEAQLVYNQIVDNLLKISRQSESGKEEIDKEKKNKNTKDRPLNEIPIKQFKNTELIQSLLEFIRQGETEEAITNLVRLLESDESYAELLQFTLEKQTEYYDLQSKILKGIVSPEGASLTLNKITRNILEIIRALEVGSSPGLLSRVRKFFTGS